MMAEEQKPTVPQPKSPVPRLLNYGQSLLSISVYILVLGFVAFRAALSQRTPLVSWNVSPAIYAFWGASVLVDFLITKLLWFLGVLFVSNSLIFAVLKLRRVATRSYWAATREVMGRGTMNDPVFWIFALVFILITAVSPTLFVGALLPSAKAPNTKHVSVIFKETVEPSLWHLSVDPSQPRRTQPLVIVAEFNDAILVEDGNTGAIVEVKNDVIAGIVDDNHITPTATAVPSGTAVGTAMPTVAATPTP